MSQKSKRDVLKQMLNLARYDQFVAIVIDPSDPDVLIPLHLKNYPAVRLNISWNILEANLELSIEFCEEHIK